MCRMKLRSSESMTGISSEITIRIRSRKGSFAVFAVMAFTSLLILIYAAIRASAGEAVSSASYACGKLWAVSILAEHDVYLKERYGLMAFAGTEAETNKKLDMYAGHTFDGRDHIKYGGISCDLEGKSISETDNMKSQIKSAVLRGITPAGYRSESGEKSVKPQEERSIRAQWILQGLPSYGKTEKNNVAGLIRKLSAGLGIDDLGSDAMINSYIGTFFKNTLNSRNLPETYFTSETEYIISGKPDDRQAANEVRKDIRGLRNAMNLFYLYSCAPKREAALALASAITPGPAAAATQAVILEIWAYAEAENDMKILYDNKTVPFIKSDSNWALSAENVFGSTAESAMEKIENTGKDEGESGYVSPQVIEGTDYEGYLTVLLCGMPEETKILRIMDLIQINMKYLYRDDFLLEEYNSGISYVMEINNRQYEFDEDYQKEDK